MQQWWWGGDVASNNNTKQQDKSYQQKHVYNMFVTWIVNLQIMANKWVGIYSLTRPICTTQDSRACCDGNVPNGTIPRNSLSLLTWNVFGRLVGWNWRWYCRQAYDFNWCWSPLLRLTDRWDRRPHKIDMWLKIACYTHASTSFLPALQIDWGIGLLKCNCTAFRFCDDNDSCNGNELVMFSHFISFIYLQT